VALRLGLRPSQLTQLKGGWIDYPGPPGTVPSLSFLKVLDHHFEPAAVRGKIVVIGATAPVLQDLHTTAAGSPMSGPEVQADAIATAMAGFPLRSSSAWVTILLIVALSVAVPLAGVRAGTLTLAVLGLALVCAWAVVAQVAFNAGTVLDFGDPLSGILLGTAAAAISSVSAEGRERRRLRAMFAADQEGLVDEVLSGTAPHRLASTSIIAGYRLEQVIGRGGMGIVYRATQLELDRTVAIKLIATEYADDAVFRERFKSESRIAAAIDHASVIPVYEAGEDQGLLFIAMRLVEGYDLGQLLNALPGLPVERVLRIGVAIAGALDAAHLRGLVHRDVKPANVLLTAASPEHAYLTDFGVARVLGSLSRVTRPGQWVGTMDYMAPEQIRGETVDTRADVYAFAGLLYHCLAGEPPFVADNDAATLWAHLSARAPKVSEHCEGATTALDEVITRGLAKAADERYDSAGELIVAFGAAVGVTVEYTSATPPPLPTSSPLGETTRTVHSS
jgi:serine/threonine-protein kinase